MNHPSTLSRRSALSLLGSTTAALSLTSPDLQAKSYLPQSTTFKGVDSFHRIVAKAQSENWRALPMGTRIMRFAKELHGLPYKSYTLEIHDRIESPSVNFWGLDCWTFFEAALGLARMIEYRRTSYKPEHLLQEIEWTRYRGGVCNGNYLDRIHYLAEWYFDNEARGNINNITRQLGYAKRLYGRKIQEMTVLWKSYRYLKNNPSLRPAMAKSEAQVARLPFYYIPKDKVSRIEHKLQPGDVLGIVTAYDGGFCSHVGLANRTTDGVLRLMHASTTYKRVVVDKSISGYLNTFKKHLGLIVGRPLPRSSTIVDPTRYRENLRKLTS